jgi:predicted TIM-barrel fold metal-dependent hydrolase
VTPDTVALETLARAGLPLDRAGITIVDAHCHLGPFRDFHIPRAGAAEMLAVADRCGVALLGISSHLAIGPDWIGGNGATADAVAAFPDRLYGHAVASPHQPDRVPAHLAAMLARPGMRAIKLHPDLHAYAVTDAGYRPAWEFAAAHGVPVICHTFHDSPYCDPKVFGEIARRYPSLPIVLIHAGAKRESFPAAIAVAREHPNLHLDVSGSFATASWIVRMVREAGADRVLFSSDVPFIDMRFSLGRVVFSALTSAEKAQVLGENAIRLFRLPRPALRATAGTASGRPGGHAP